MMTIQIMRACLSVLKIKLDQLSNLVTLALIACCKRFNINQGGSDEIRINQSNL